MSKNELIAAAEGTVATCSEWDVRGHLAASLTCWHRLTEKEADELVAMFKRRPEPATRQTGKNWKLVPVDPTGIMKDCGAGSLPLSAAKPWAAGDCYRAMIAAAPCPTAQVADRELRDALPTIKGASITGGYVVVTPAGRGSDKAAILLDAILRTFPVNPAFSPRPDDAAPATKGGG